MLVSEEDKMVVARQSLSEDHTFLKVLGTREREREREKPIIYFFSLVLSGHCYTDCTSLVTVSL